MDTTWTEADPHDEGRRAPSQQPRREPATGSPEPPFTQVVVPIDPDQPHHRELQPARTLARLAGAEVVLLTVMRHGRHPDQQVERRLDEVARALGDEQPRVEIVNDGHVADAIAGFAASKPGSIICMASHGPGRLPENLHTTVSAPVVRMASCPVVLVGPQCDRLDPSYTSMIACVDDTPIAGEVAAHAGAWAQAFGLDLWLVDTVARPERADTLVDEPVGHDVWEAGYIRNMALAIRERGGAPQWDVLHHGDPGHPQHAIVDYLRARPQALAMMGSHHHTPLQHLTHSSVIMQVTHHATNPTVVIPQGQLLQT